MRLTIVAAGVAALTLAACGQQDDTPAMDETVAAEDMAVDSSASVGGAASAPEPAPVVDSAMQETAVPPAAGVAGPVTDDTRADAQARAEETNLHPRTE